MIPSPAPSTALRLTGRDALAVLHRVTTQALADLPAGAARATLFCDFRGRLLQRAVVAQAPDGALWLLRDCAPAAGLVEAVERAVFREEVALEDRSAEVVVGRIADDGPPGATFDAEGPSRVATGDGTALVRGAPPMDDAARVRLGIAAHGAEIADAFNPFEIGLGAEVHLDKGCFTGQEALQRLVTYHSVRRTLVRISGEAGAPRAGEPVRAAEAEAGVLTTVVSAPADRGWSALAVVRLDALDSGAAWALASGEAVRVEHRFEAPRPLGRP
jgi:folate-binding protein YgfZ